MIQIAPNVVYCQLLLQTSFFSIFKTSFNLHLKKLGLFSRLIVVFKLISLVKSENYFTEEPTTMTTSSKTTVYTTTIADTTTTSYKYTTTFTTTTTPFVTTTGDYSSTRTTGTIISTTYTTRAPLTKPGDSLVNPYRPTVKPLYPDPSKDNNEPTSTATTSTMTTTTMTTTTSTTGTNSGIFGDQSQSSSNDLSRGLQYISTELLLFGYYG